VLDIGCGDSASAGPRGKEGVVLIILQGEVLRQ
jgi:hypothetical protein